ncbi:unnamed protein product [Amoebophrya sp. A25]|nr:unnamed protein product [Amoebophrya sp. A25]|eukprot:GSA25T00015598001.1
MEEILNDRRALRTSLAVRRRGRWPLHSCPSHRSLGAVRRTTAPLTPWLASCEIPSKQSTLQRMGRTVGQTVPEVGKFCLRVRPSMSSVGRSTPLLRYLFQTHDVATQCRIRLSMQDQVSRTRGQAARLLVRMRFCAKL